MPEIPDYVGRLVIEGVCSNGVDVWNIVYHFRGETEHFNEGDLNNIAEQAVGYFNTDLWSKADVTSIFAAEASLTGATCYALDTNNTVLLVGSYALATPVPGGHTDALPPEVSICVTHLTGRAGRSYTGRAYLAGISIDPCNPAGQLQVADCLTLATEYSNMLDDVNSITYGTADAFGIQLGVLSLTKGVITDINAVKIGNVFDSQRRRRNGTPEIYSSVPVG